jgi:asparagine N-glycosylation enzyme membrane subunit Stt3
MPPQGSAAAGGNIMEAMQPVWVFLNNLEGFDFAAFWIAAFTLTTMAGFFLDYVMQRQGFGPYFNALYVFAGVWVGLYVRFNYLRGYQGKFHDPYLTISTIFCVIILMLTSVAFVRNRFS